MKRRIGIIGAGQLAQMLIQSANPKKNDFVCLDKQDAPAHKLCQKSIFAETSDGSKYNDLIQGSDTLTIEIENIDLPALKDRACIPPVACLEILTNKLKQKEFLLANDYPTAKFSVFGTYSDLIASSWQEGMIKTASGGYDGRGVFFWNKTTSSSLEKLFEQEVYIEEKVDVRNEYAILCARNAKGEKRSFDVAEMQMAAETSQLAYLFAPANISSDLDEKIRALAFSIVDKLNYVGILAIEFFLNPEGELLINEMAPRPHNSAHHTIEACKSSQYDQLLAILNNEDLPSTLTTSASAMLNVIGLKKSSVEEILAKEGDNIYFHYYNKAVRKNRKMGHITVLASTTTDAIAKVEQIQQRIKNYENSHSNG